MLAELRDYLVEHWHRLQPGSTRPRDLAFLVQATGVGKLCCYIFGDSASEPQWVAKIPRSPADNAVLVYEYGLIQHLRRHGSEFVRATIPGPLLATSIARHFVVVESFISGRSMDGLLIEGRGDGQAKTREFLDRAACWLLRSQQETLGRWGRLTDKDVQTYFLAPIAELRTCAQLTDIEQSYLDRLEERAVELARRPLPLVFNHGDFRPANVLLNGGAIRVIDWEFGQPLALPLMDVFSLLSRVHARSHGLEEIDGYLEDYLDSFEALFFQGGAFGGLTVEYVRRACEALDIDPEWIPLLLAMFLVVEANKYHTFLGRRARQGYVYLLRSRARQLGRSYVEQLARQKNVWLLGHLAEHEERLVFGRSAALVGRPLEEQWLWPVQEASYAGLSR